MLPASPAESRIGGVEGSAVLIVTGTHHAAGHLRCALKPVIATATASTTAADCDDGVHDRPHDGVHHPPAKQHRGHAGDGDEEEEGEEDFGHLYFPLSQRERG